MRKAVFKCEACMFESTRRWNIDRHIRIVHNGNAVAFSPESGKLSSNYGTSRMPMWQSLLPYPHNINIHEYEQQFTGIEFDLRSIMTKKEKIMVSIYEELSKKINALEDLASSNQINANQIPAFLIFALFTEDPVHTLDEIIRLERFKSAKQKVNSYASRVIQGNPLLVDSLVSTMILEGPYYKHKFQFQPDVKSRK